MKYTEIKMTIDEKYPDPSSFIDTIIEKLGTIGIYGSIISDPREFQYMIDNLSDTEWYDSEDISDDWLHTLSEPPSVTFYLNQGTSYDSKKTEIESIFSAEIKAGSVKITISDRDDSQWKDKWKEFFTPTKITDRVTVIPSWIKSESLKHRAGSESIYTNDGITVLIDPGQAFGTGTHETTSLTIRLMEKYLKPGDRVLDVGTGSGILSIIASKLGASEVLGIDIDEESVAVANKNVALNTEGHSILILRGNLAKGLDFEADIIVANLLHDLIIRFSDDAAEHLAPGGIFISSGILTEKEPLVAEAIREAGLKIMETLHDGEWSAIAASKSD